MATGTLSRTFERTLGWVRRNQRWISAALFAFGFVDHIVTFGLLPLPIEILIFEGYLIVIAVCTVLSHMTAGRSGGKVIRATALLAPLVAQLTIGGILAGFVVFYTKSAVVAVSWPFLILLAIIYIGGEVLRDYREHLVFQTVLLYFSLYALAIFALPTYLGRLSKDVFLESTALSVGLFLAFLVLLALLGWNRLKRTLLPIVISCSVLTAAIVAAYFTHLLPPIPLALTDSGIYQSIVHTSDGYDVQGEQPALWWEFKPTVVHHVPGDALYAYSAVFAPTEFSSGIVHRWQHYDPTSKKWTDEAVIAFTVSGGRENGYRGYSIKADPEQGKWRVRVETLEGQVIGEMRFTVQNVPVEPTLVSQTL